MSLTKMTVVHYGISGLPTDRYVNDFYLEKTGDFDDTDADNAADTAYGFYHTTFGTVAPIYDYMSDRVVRGTGEADVNFYDWPAGGSPTFVRSIDPNAIGSVTDLPEEVAIVLSFHGDLTGIPEFETNPTPPPARFRPAAQKRGRVFIGPLNVGPLDKTATGVRVSADAQDDICRAAIRFQDDLNSNGLTWVVWSPTAGVASPVVGGWVDDAFDTQRRRGVPASSRETWSV